MKSAEVVWNAESLHAWLENPGAFIPGNRMTFRGIPDEGARDDLIAYLEQATAAGTGAPQAAPRAPMADLKAVEPARQVTAIRYCGDTYRVTTQDGESVPFWEFNLRFKTDSSDNGPASGRPVLLRAAMMGDRAFVIFSSPQEIATFIKVEC
ncbi:MAG: c-type cytochrome [Kiloniellales bacterium]